MHQSRQNIIEYIVNHMNISCKGFQDSVSEYIRNCVKFNNKLVAILPNIFQINQSSKSKERFQADITELPKEMQQEYKYLFNIIDYFLKFANSYPQNEKDGQTTVENINKFFIQFGVPTVIQTDNGKEFNNKQFQLMIDKFPPLKHITSSPYHSQSQGAVESFNRKIKNALWDMYLSRDESKPFDLNKQILYYLTLCHDTIHSSTKFRQNDLFNQQNIIILEQAKQNQIYALKQKQRQIDTIIENQKIKLLNRIKIDKDEIKEDFIIKRLKRKFDIECILIEYEKERLICKIKLQPYQKHEFLQQNTIYRCKLHLLKFSQIDYINN